jgi:hypothetical protein
MNPPSMEVIFLLLSGVILVAGVLYWFWSHLQLTQKKVQLLENAVFELRTMLLSSEHGPPVHAPASVQQSTKAAPAVDAAGYEDLGDDEWDADGEESAPVTEKVVDRPDDASAIPVVAPTTVIREVYEEQETDLMPGGRILQPTETEVASLNTAASTLLSAPAPEAEAEEQFRDLFVAKASASASSSPVDVPVAESLESMPVKELRRLAQERGIAGAADMRKKEILAALRQQVTAPSAATLDLTKMGAVEEAEATFEEGEFAVEEVVDEIPAAE